MSDTNADKVTLTPKEFAARFGRKETWGYRKIWAGKVKVLPEGRYQIPLSEVDRLLATCTTLKPKKPKAK